MSAFRISAPRRWAASSILSKQPSSQFLQVHCCDWKSRTRRIDPLIVCIVWRDRNLEVPYMPHNFWASSWVFRSLIGVWKTCYSASPLWRLVTSAVLLMTSHNLSNDSMWAPSRAACFFTWSSLLEPLSPELWCTLCGMTHGTLSRKRTDQSHWSASTFSSQFPFSRQ